MKHITSADLLTICYTIIGWLQEALKTVKVGIWAITRGWALARDNLVSSHQVWKDPVLARVSQVYEYSYPLHLLLNFVLHCNHRQFMKYREKETSKHGWYRIDSLEYDTVLQDEDIQNSQNLLAYQIAQNMFILDMPQPLVVVTWTVVGPCLKQCFLTVWAKSQCVQMLAINSEVSANSVTVRCIEQ